MIPEPPRSGVAVNEGTGAVLPRTALRFKTVAGASRPAREVTISPWQQTGWGAILR
jgi:hypothetical protein